MVKSCLCTALPLTVAGLKEHIPRGPQTNIDGAGDLRARGRDRRELSKGAQDKEKEPGSQDDWDFDMPRTCQRLCGQ